MQRKPAKTQPPVIDDQPPPQEEQTPAPPPAPVSIPAAPGVSRIFGKHAREWAEHLLSEKQLQASGILNVQEVRGAWANHLSGRQLRHHEIWTVLMLQAWLGRTPGAYA